MKAVRAAARTKHTTEVGVTPELIACETVYEDASEVRIHATAEGLRRLVRTLERLAACTEAGEATHDHLMSEEWGGHELAALRGDENWEPRPVHNLTIHAWPEAKAPTLFRSRGES